MLITEGKITEIYCLADDFCKLFSKGLKKHQLIHEDGKKHRNKPNRMHLRHLFPKNVSYNRFTELQKEVLFPMSVFIKKVLLGKCTGISYVDSSRCVFVAIKESVSQRYSIDYQSKKQYEEYADVSC